MKFAIAVLAGALTGVVSAWGIGGGTLLVIYMSAFAKVPQQSAQGINLLYFLPTAAAALITHIKNKLVDWEAVIPTVVAGVPAAIAASLLAMHLETDIMRKIFGWFVIAVGVSEFFRKTKPKKDDA
ncbi:MAG: sulfite exporter TauE/SafE family protein [Oscillospiraceae bacterium]|jgi:uncharacterized membrane protein YfcA|nr:sulfite exporter TauE/SafE family protein [Oscillospiraceae bacterium]